MYCYFVGMERIGIRELRQHASRYLRQVKDGQTVEVTERGRLIALLVPPQRGGDVRDRLVESGRLIPRSRPFELPRLTPIAPGRPGTAAVLDDLREDR